jgi:capsular polysaccharide biosynthesis protein/Mrp family chromosome partitioning ATPase
MNLRQYLTIVRSRWSIVLAIMIFSALVAGVQAARSPRSYTAHSSVFFSVGVGRAAGAGDLTRGFSYAEGLATSYAQVATGPVVLDPVIAQLGLPTTAQALAKSITAQVPVDTVLVDITVHDAQAARSAAIANAVARQLVNTVDSTSPATHGTGQASALQVTVASEAEVAGAPSSPRIAVTLTIAILLGFVVGVVAAFVRDLLDSRIRGERDVAQLTSVPVLGAVPSSRPGPGRRSPLQRRNRASEKRARALKRNFQHLRARRSLHSVVLTSAGDGFHAATATRIVGQLLANAGVRTVVVDVDFRQPRLSEGFSLMSEPGLAEVLRGARSWPEVVHQRDPALLHVLPAGVPTDDPSLAVHGSAMARLVQELSTRYEMILIKAPPVLHTADGLMLCRMSDAVIIVADAPAMRRNDLLDETRALAVAGVEPTGIVLVA